MSLKAASSLMSHTGPGGCKHSRDLIDDGEGNMIAAPGDWILTCGTCEASLADHELWGPANEPAPLTVDEIRLRDAQHADATRNLWSGLASMPDQFAALSAQNHEQFAALVLQNQGVMAVLAKMLGVDVSSGLPPIPAGMVQGQAPAVPPPPPAAPVQDAVPPAAAEKTTKKTAAKKAPPRAQKPAG